MPTGLGLLLDSVAGVQGGGLPVWEVPVDSGDGLTWFTRFRFATSPYNQFGVIVVVNGRWYDPHIGDYTVNPALQSFTLDASVALQAGEKIHVVYWPSEPVTSNPNLQARLFGGGTDNLTWGALAPHFILGDLSIGMWVKLSNLTSDNELLVQRGWGGGSITAYQLSLKTSPTEWSIQYHHDDASDTAANVVLTPPGGLPEDRWFYLGLSRDVSAQTVVLYWIYEDGSHGQVSGSWAGQVDPGGSGASPGVLQFGGASHIALQEHYVSNVLWSLSDHQAAWSGNPPASGLVLSVRALGASPEADESATGASGTVSGTTLVAGHG